MARFVSLLLIGPWLIVLGWLYWLYVRPSHAGRRSARRDACIVMVAFATAIVGAAIAWQAALGHGGPVWKFVASPLGAYLGFNLVLGCGLLLHWRLRRRVANAASATPDEPASG